MKKFVILMLLAGTNIFDEWEEIDKQCRANLSHYQKAWGAFAGKIDEAQFVAECVNKVLEMTRQPER